MAAQTSPGDRAWPPGPGRLGTWFGRLAYMIDPLRHLDRLAARHGDVAAFRLDGHTVYAISDPEIADDVLRGHPEDFDKGWRDLRLRRRPKPYRGIVQPAFHAGRMDGYAPAIVAATEDALRRWPTGETRDLLREMIALCLDGFSRALFATPLPRPPEELAGAVVDINHYLGLRTAKIADGRFAGTAKRNFRQGLAQFDRTLRLLITQRRAEGSLGDDLLSRLIAARDGDGRASTNRDIRSQLLKPFTAGPDTTALLIAYALHLIATHPDVEAKLRGEIDTVLGDRPVTAADLPALTILDGVLRETMRLYPSLWVIGRGALRDTRIGSFFAPEGTQILLRIGAMHRDPRWFAKPEAFRPERWHGDFARSLPRGAYLPLGNGPHICLGNHFGLLLASVAVVTLLRDRRMTMTDGRSPKLLASTTLRPARPIHARMSLL